MIIDMKPENNKFPKISSRYFWAIEIVVNSLRGFFDLLFYILFQKRSQIVSVNIVFQFSKYRTTIISIIIL